MANPKVIITYQDPNAQAVCKLSYRGSDHKEQPHSIVVEQRYTDAEGAENWSPARSRMPVEVTLAHVLDALGRGNVTATVDKKTGSVRIDATKVEF